MQRRCSRKLRTASALAGAAALAAALGLTAVGSAAGAPPTGRAAQAAPNPVCNYYFEWLHAVRFPLQPDPHAAYTYVIPSTQAATDHVGFVVSGAFQHGAWTSTDVYDSKANPYAVGNDNKIVPDPGSSNPFVSGTLVNITPRNFSLLYLPKGVTQAQTAANLQAIPAANVFPTPTSATDKSFILANRLYQAFAGYNQGGAGGPTNTPMPTVTAVNYDTGQPVDCSQYNQLPDAIQSAPTDMPTAPTRLPPARIKLKNGEFMGRVDAGTSGVAGFEGGPPNPKGKLVFTRIPLAAGADVSSIPPPDNCSGYLGTPTDVTRINLIRMPHLPTYFDVDNVTNTTTYGGTESSYVSYNIYGTSIQRYVPGSTRSSSLGDNEFMVDKTGGSTVLVWPRNLRRSERVRVFAYAKRHGWPVMRGGTAGPATTANLLIREKGSSAYANGVDGVPCYYGTPANPMHTGERWNQVRGATYQASPSNIGPGAPQGVTCSARKLTSGRCLRDLKRYIKQSGGSYFDRSGS
jgi:hypothetical protein